MVDKGLPKLLNQTFESATVVNFQNLSSLLTAIAGQMDEMKTEQVSNQPVNTWKEGLIRSLQHVDVVMKMQFGWFITQFIYESNKAAMILKWKSLSTNAF